MRSSTELITCFDDKKNLVIGMTSIIPAIKPTGNFAEICDTAVLREYDNLQIKSSLMVKAADIIQEKGFTLL